MNDEQLTRIMNLEAIDDSFKLTKSERQFVDTTKKLYYEFLKNGLSELPAAYLAGVYYKK